SHSVLLYTLFSFCNSPPPPRLSTLSLHDALPIFHARRIYDCEDNPFLADFYKAKPGSAFRAQMYFLIERQKRLREALDKEIHLRDRKSTRLNSSHVAISYAVFCLKKKTKNNTKVT